MKKLLCSVITILLMLGVASCKIPVYPFQYASDKRAFDGRVGTKWVCYEPPIELEIVEEDRAIGTVLINGEQVELKFMFGTISPHCNIIHIGDSEMDASKYLLRSNYEIYENRFILRPFEESEDKLFNNQYEELTFYLQE